jgi:hypothetical protein
VGKMSHAGSSQEFPDRRGRCWRGSWLVPASKGHDHDHAAAAARAWRADFSGFIWHGGVRNRGGEQPAGLGEVVLAGRAGKQPVAADAMESAGEDIEQEAADELVGGKRHDLLPVWIVAASVLVAERDVGLVEVEKAPVRDGDAVTIARQASEYGLRPGERRLGIDHTVRLPGRGEMVKEVTAVGERCERSEEGEAPPIVQLE